LEQRVQRQLIAVCDRPHEQFPVLLRRVGRRSVSVEEMSEGFGLGIMWSPVPSCLCRVHDRKCCPSGTPVTTLRPPPARGSSIPRPATPRCPRHLATSRRRFSRPIHSTPRVRPPTRGS